MTVASETNRSGPYTGNGVTTIFDYGFRILDENHVKVIRTEAGVETILVVNTDYIVSGVGDAGGGSVATTVPPTADQTITILWNVPFTQETDLENQGAYFAETIEAALDLSVMRDQQLRERLETGISIALDAENTLAQATAAAAASSASADISAASAVAASGSADDAAGSAADAAGQLALFKGVYYGPLAADPSLDPNGNACGVGDLYFNTTDFVLKIFQSGVWTPVNSGSGMATAATIAALKDTDPADGQVYLTEVGRSGMFLWRAGDYSTHIAADTNNGVYVKADSTAATVGAWVREFDFQDYQSKWFGAVADHSTDNTAVINTMIAVSNLPNTNMTAGKQRAAFINIEGGVRFASENLSWLPNEDWVFIFLNYFANSDTTKGVSTGGGGTNERLTLSVNSGFPGDATGAIVCENLFAGILNPGVGVNVKKNADSSIAAHIGASQQVQPTSTHPVRGSVATVQDENFERFRVMYENYGKIDSNNAIFMYVGNRKTFLAVTGGNGAGAWGADVPVVGDVVRGIDTNSRYVVTSLATANALDTNWLSGTAVPGDTLMRERAIFRGSISGTTLTVTVLDQGSISTGHRLLGMFANSGVVAGTTIVGQNSGTPGGVGVYTVSNSQTVAFTQLVTGNVSANPIQGGGVTNTDTHATPIKISLDGASVTFNSAGLPGTRTPFFNESGALTATMTNAPVSGNPTKWVRIDDNGTIRRIPMW